MAIPLHYRDALPVLAGIYTSDMQAQVGAVAERVTVAAADFPRLLGTKVSLPLAQARRLTQTPFIVLLLLGHSKAQ